MKVDELSLILGRLEALYVAAGAKAAAKELKALSDALRPHRGVTVDSLCSQLREVLIRQGEKAGGRRKPSLGAPAIPRSRSIRHHVTQLRNSGTDRLAFDWAFGELKSDRTIKLADVAEIARQYAESVTKYKSIRAAHEDISRAFVRQARFENKLG